MPENPPGHPVPQSTAPRALLIGWLTAFAAAFALYAATASRGAQWQDSGTHIYRMLSGEMINPLGLALSHPLHQWLGRFAAWLWPANPSYAITLISSLAAAVTVANLYGCMRSLTASNAAASFAAASLAIAHTFWQMATIAEAYTLVTATLSSEVWCLIAFSRSRRPMFLWLAFALNGLGFANHNAALLTAPILIAITVLNLHQRRLRWQDIAACAAVWLVGSLPYTWLIVAGLKASGDWAGVVRSALFGHSYSEEVLNSRLSTKKLFVSACFIGLNFPNLTIPLAMLGLLAARQYAAGVRRILYANLLIHFLFVIRYPVVDQHTFFLPTYFLTAAFAGLGMARLFQLSPWGRRVVWAAVVFLCTTPVVYAFVPGLARRFDVLAGYARNKPFRDDYAYVFTPWTAFDHSAERMARRALELGGSDALVIAPDSMVAPAIWYEAWLSGKDRVEVVGVFDAEQIAQAAQSKRRVLFVPPRTTQEPDAVAGGTWRREDDFYLLQPGEAGGGP